MRCHIRQCFGLQVPVKGKFSSSGQKILYNLYPNYICFSNNLCLIQGEIYKFQIFKNIASPGKKVSKSRNWEASRRLRNADLGNLPHQLTGSKTIIPNFGSQKNKVNNNINNNNNNNS